MHLISLKIWTLTGTLFHIVKEASIVTTRHHRHPIPFHNCSCNLKHYLISWWRHQMETFSALPAFNRWPVNFPPNGQWRGALMSSLISVWTNSWVNNRFAGDLIRHRGHYDVTVMFNSIKQNFQSIHRWKKSRRRHLCILCELLSLFAVTFSKTRKIRKHRDILESCEQSNTTWNKQLANFGNVISCPTKNCISIWNIGVSPIFWFRIV